ncbi:hypothetical protein PDE_04322 [Penicillium oxalicum 114-2]|uniref:PAC domain-containing protein n=1 Tax=Penicillium oxalicum (strain 114-2 / CGMCC 5302) TaxID=933388 RepID=S8ATE7_PENO1|nr:hypothetical protein PDE_04322 [Penicillium oxalicum 114-2]
MSYGDFHDEMLGLDSDSLRSGSESLRDEYHEWMSESGRNSRAAMNPSVPDRPSPRVLSPLRTDHLLDEFPHPPSRPKGLDIIAEEKTTPPQSLAENAYPTPKSSIKNMRRHATAHELPLLQESNPYEEAKDYNPVNEEGPSYELIAPWDGIEAPLHKLERLSDVMFGKEHMLCILNNPRYLARFREFLLDERPRSISTLTYYLNAVKALKALEYANTLIRLSTDVPPPAVQAIQNETEAAGITINKVLERRIEDGLNALVAEELPAYITSRCITITSKIVEERVRGTLPMKFRDTANALAEVFCLTDPSRPDNPIIFASKEFHRTTQYGMDYVLGRNCRFLQGPQTNPNSVRRLRESLKAGRHHSELFLNYRRDGSPFMNLLQCAPLYDSKGTVKYVIGAQIDVSGLALDGVQMESLLELQSRYRDPDEESIAEMSTAPHKDEFRQLCELFSPKELNAVQEYGGDLFHPLHTRPSSRNQRQWHPRGGSMDSEAEAIRLRDVKSPLLRGLTGAYENYLLVRPYPSLRVLFTSPSLQIPGILQSSFLSRIGSSSSVKEELMAAMQQGHSVTARIKWITRYNCDGRSRWIHCTPLYASNGQVGVWMVVVVDDEEEQIPLNWRA